MPLPPPSALKRKILIKNKRLKPDVEKVQLEQFLAEGKLDEENDDVVENPDVVVGEDGPLESRSPNLHCKHVNQSLTSLTSH